MDKHEYVYYLCCNRARREKVSWCFTPIQPVRLYQGEQERERERESVRACVRACVRARARARVRVCVCVCARAHNYAPSMFSCVCIKLSLFSLAVARQVTVLTMQNSRNSHTHLTWWGICPWGRPLCWGCTWCLLPRFGSAWPLGTPACPGGACGWWCCRSSRRLHSQGHRPGWGRRWEGSSRHQTTQQQLPASSCRGTTTDEAPW